ncbi:MAG: hypothetical protein LIO57_09225, partial [Oscillospiraceae bacterium]|nr:hypothetical protein [Oscillospiraceae bacterium]
MFGKQKDFASVGQLIEGLPVPANTTIIATLTDEGLQINALTGKKEADWKKFELALEKIENIQLINEREIQQVLE